MTIIDSVRGMIIGEVTWPYEFWKDGHKIAWDFFNNDDEAKAWFKEHYPEFWRQGVEMRVFDQEKTR
jgi:hypothetical protein